MRWDNWGKGAGKWHVDHIVPCREFNLLRPVEQRACFHFTNLQPLWEAANYAKNRARPGMSDISRLMRLAANYR